MTADSKTNSSIEQRPDTSAPTSISSPRRQKRYGALGSESPIIYWSEFENQEEEPFMVSVEESTPFLPWSNREDSRGGASFKTLRKMVDAVEAEMKRSADGLTALFYEKNQATDDEEANLTSEEDSSVIDDPRRPTQPHESLSRQSLLNRGYCLCVVGCTILLSLFGLMGVILSGEATGIAFILVGFLIAMTLEIVSLVRFVMQGGHGAVAWLGFVVVALAGSAFVPLVAISEGG